jgi:protein disulfide-isomerase A1
VRELQEDTFKDFTKNNRFAFVYFYSPTCKYCKILEPEFHQLSEDPHFADVEFGKIDATTHEALSQQYEVQGFPSLFFIDHSFVLPYQHERSQEHMAQWITNYFQDNVERISHEELNNK